MKRNGLRLALCGCFIAAVLFSGFFIVSGPYHDCCGEACPVCCLLQGAANFFRRLTPVFPLVLVSLLLPGILVLRPFALIPVSSVRLKVKINR